MLDLTRRKLVVGLGFLATGSGATFTSAEFDSSSDATSDIQVTGEDKLTVEPGALFRNAEGSFDPDASDPGSELTNDTASSLFDPNGSSGSVGDGLDEVEQLPAAAVNDATNAGITLQVALPLGERGTIGGPDDGLLQVRNEGVETHEIAIRYVDSDGEPGFGSDVGTSGDPIDDGIVRRGLVPDIVSFTASGTRISPSRIEGERQPVAATATVESGGVVQVALRFNTTNEIGDPGAEDQLAAAATTSESPFEGPSTDTIDLLDAISVGSEDGE